MERSLPAVTRASAYVAAVTVVLGFAELSSALPRLSALGLAGVFALSASLGGLLGLVLGAYLHLSLRAPLAVRVICDVLLGGAVTAWLFDELGILAKWGGETMQLARLSGAGAVGFGLMLVV